MASVLQPEVNRSFGVNSGNLTRDINDIKSSGQYYVTHELNRDLNHIQNGVNHMRLDSDFINRSKEWGRNFDQDALNREKAESAAKMGQGSSYMNQYKGTSQTPRVQSMQENQVREMHQWAGNSLKDVGKELHPYATSAQTRIDQFCDHIGVTDRFTGYRNNLTRGSRDPTKLGMWWLRKSADTSPYQTQTSYSGAKPEGKVYLPASLPARRMQGSSLSVDNFNPLQNGGLKTQQQVAPKSIQERCGINTTFPGITEYMKRYNAQRAPEKLTAYNINPAPDFTIYGRPSAEAEYIPKFTEYQSRYEWPECRKITKKPWLRK